MSTNEKKQVTRNFTLISRLAIAFLFLGSVSFTIACGDASQAGLGEEDIQQSSGAGTAVPGGGGGEPTSTPTSTGGNFTTPTAATRPTAVTQPTTVTQPTAVTQPTGGTDTETGGAIGTDVDFVDAGQDDGSTGANATDDPTVIAGSGGGTGSGTGSGSGSGTCCPDGDCLCHGPDPSDRGVLSLRGPFRATTVPGRTGIIHYPSDAEPPFAGIALCGGFLNTGLEMQGWGTFYASWGIVTVITSTGGGDMPDLRGRKLLASIEELKSLNNNASSPLSGKMSDRYGISGYSMGGGGTTIGCVSDPTLKTGVGMAPWGPVSGMRVPTLFICGSIDIVAGQQVPRTAAGVPAKQVVISGYDHMRWFGPSDISGYYALAWQKTYLEGDTRWEPLLSEQLPGVSSMR